MYKRIKIYSVFAFLFISLNGISQSNRFEVIRSLELMDQIYEHLEKYYVDDIKTGSLSKTAIDAMLKELDPYTVYYHESNIEDYKLMTTGQYGGIGALIGKNGDFIVVSEPYEGKPADVSGLKAGDVILSIDGKSMKGKNSSDASTALKGPKGTELILEIERNKTEKKTIIIVRDEIKLADVPYSGVLENNTGYIKLNSFTRTASSEVTKSFLKLKEQGIDNLILDLRGNGGGLLIEAIKIVNLFVEQGQTIVTTKGRLSDENRTYKTLAPPVDTEIPLIILVDGGSASASEIVSGSLQDLDRAVIVGSRSYGKGLVQRTYDLDYGSKMKLTIAKYYTPSGRCVQRLEYYDKIDGEIPEEVPDSLITMFKTKNGRDVIDGRGVEPDSSVSLENYSRLTINLVRNNIIFNYATNYYYNHPTISEAGKFSLSESDYNAFSSFAMKEEFSYSTASEEMLKKLKATAKKEGFFNDAESAYNELMSKVTPSKERDLIKFKSEIVSIIENEIVSRYYFQNGRAIHSFKDDPFMDKAMEIFLNKALYNTILGNSSF